MKKIIALFVCFCLLFGTMAGSVSAAKKEPTKEDLLIKSARQSYVKSLAAAGKSSFHGYCGLMTSCQMHSLGINKWRVTNDGNKQFDYYSTLEVTSGGYYITPYFLEEYSLQEALMHVSRNGTRDVYNILVGFQWTNTAAGSRFGHAVFINGILDGTVYFVESYDCGIGQYYPEGSVITCSIADFVAFYEPWTTYEGLIWFGNGEYADGCDLYGTDLMIQTRFDTTLRSQPSVVGQNGSEVLRSVAAGERFRAIAVLEDPMGDRYYRVTDGDITGYIAAAAAFTIRVNPEDLTLLDLKIPQRIAAGDPLELQGQALAENGSIHAVEVTVTDSAGSVVGSVSYPVRDFCMDLRAFNGRLPELTEGVYMVHIYGICDQSVVAGQELRTAQARILLGGQLLQVGGSGHSGKAYPLVQKQVEQERSGWFWEDGSWFCYEGDSPKSGWVEHAGIRYYLDENGMAVTGWQTIDGTLYKFSGSGALLRGMEAELDGTVYVLADDGVATPKGKE